MEINDIVILYGNMFGILYDQGQSHGGTLKCFCICHNTNCEVKYISWKL